MGGVIRQLNDLKKLKLNRPEVGNAIPHMKKKICVSTMRNWVNVICLSLV